MATRTDPEVEKDVVKAYQDGLGGNTIAREFDIGLSTVYNILRRRDVERRSGARPRMFSPKEERAIARRYADGEPTSQIAKGVNCSELTVRTIADRRGVPIRDRGPRPRQWDADTRERVAARYMDGESQQAIADDLNVSQATISRIVRDEGLSTSREKERHHNWNGGRTRAGQYVAVRVGPDSEFASMRTQTGYVLEHRLVMAKHLGRPLTRRETVHHINGDKTDNRLENLQLRHGRHGKGEAMVCADCGSHNVIPAPLED